MIPQSIASFEVGDGHRPKIDQIVGPFVFNANDPPTTVDLSIMQSNSIFDGALSMIVRISGLAVREMTITFGSGQRMFLNSLTPHIGLGAIIPILQPNPVRFTASVAGPQPGSYSVWLVNFHQRWRA